MFSAITLPRPQNPKPRRIFGATLAILGVALAPGGVELAALGGSWFYVVAALALVGLGVLMWRGHPRAPALFGIGFLAVAVWSVAEVGLQPWGLLARLALFAVLGLWLVAPHALNLIRHPAAAVVFVLGLIVIGVSLFPKARAGDDPSMPVVAADGDWLAYGHDLGGARFSPLNQVNVGNVAGLRPAWTFHTGEIGQAGGNIAVLHGLSAMETTPLAVGGVLYFCTGHSRAVAVDAETGKLLWAFDPHATPQQETHSTCRGLAYFQRPPGASPNLSGPPQACERRVFIGSLDAKLWALDAVDGRPCADFGQGGAVSLREGLGFDGVGYHMTSPGLVAKGLIVVGAWISDNQSVDAPSGVIRAFDAVSGKLAWAWDAGRPDLQDPLPPNGRYTPSTPNAWANFAADEALNLVYVPTGNASPDLWGGRRRPFDDAYSSAVVALDLTTGRPRWVFQTTHHDLWDYDVPAQPVLANVRTRQGVQPALIQATKHGDIYVLDRRTGRPIVPVTERPVPQHPSPGDRLSPTQPFSAMSVRRPDLTEAQMWGLTPFDQLWCRIRFRQARYEGVFTPPGEAPTINFPGSSGAISWGGVSVDEAHQLVIANSSAIPFYMQLVPRGQAPAFAQRIYKPVGYEWVPMAGTPYVGHIRPFLSPLRVPCSQPPWGFLQAFDLATGRTVWKRTLGTARDSGPLGHAIGLPLPIGVPSQGGAMTTAGGLTFIGATADNYLRAFETTTGRELWKARLPSGGQATPMTYRGPGGRQFVVIAAGGHAALASKPGDAVLAFSLRP